MRVMQSPRRADARRRLSPSFIFGASIGVAVTWTFSQVTLVLGLGRPPVPLAAPLSPPAASGYHALVVPAGGQGEDGPPPHVAARLERAVHMYTESGYPKPYVITTAWGTPHKPCPHDAAGFERHEAADNARFLVERGVPPSHILEEAVSLETVGNAFFARVMHTETRGLRRLAVINNNFHMPRTRAVFEHGMHASIAARVATRLAWLHSYDVCRGADTYYRDHVLVMCTAMPSMESSCVPP